MFLAKLWKGVSHLLLGLEHITAENIALTISGNVAEDLQILWVMRNVEYSKKNKKNKTKSELVKNVRTKNPTNQGSILKT